VPSSAILVSAVLVLLCGQTDRITEADDRYTHAIYTVGVSNDNSLPSIALFTTAQYNTSTLFFNFF